MNDKKKRKLIRKYFRTVPKWAYTMTVVSLLFLLGVYWDPALLVVVLLTGIPAAWGLYRGMAGKPTDRQMDQWLAEDLKAIERNALDEHGIVEEDLENREPIVVYGPYPELWLKKGEVKSDLRGALVAGKTGADGRIRFTPLRIWVIHFTKQQLLCYQTDYDFAGPATYGEVSEDFNYGHVSGFRKTKVRHVEEEDATKIKDFVGFELRALGRSMFSLAISSSTLEKRVGGGEFPLKATEETINGARRMLREKQDRLEREKSSIL